MSADTDKWEFYTDKKGEHRWRRTASNGNIVGSATEGYSKKSYAVANAERHGYEGNPKKLGATDDWEFYTDKGGSHRWRRLATNKEVVGSSSEGYSSKAACLENAKRNGYAG
jgi:uncharacterized protein YegP (UPF0339 family)